MGTSNSVFVVPHGTPPAGSGTACLGVLKEEKQNLAHRWATGRQQQCSPQQVWPPHQDLEWQQQMLLLQRRGAFLALVWGQRQLQRVNHHSPLQTQQIRARLVDCVSLAA
mmetsp:Transcript_133218/g.371370  ORF Transcript_133218/g.371370 Transcript_133218/m.371370 type:complete len:110 (-) Transcript_133218:410-739(-)